MPKTTAKPDVELAISEVLQWFDRNITMKQSFEGDDPDGVELIDLMYKASAEVFTDGQYDEEKAHSLL